MLKVGSIFTLTDRFTIHTYCVIDFYKDFSETDYRIGIMKVAKLGSKMQIQQITIFNGKSTYSLGSGPHYGFIEYEQIA